MSNADSTAPSVHAISIWGADWKHDRFNRTSPTANFAKWSKALEIFLSLLGLKFYVFEPFISVPKASSEPVAYRNWLTNDDLARAVIMTALDEAEYEGLDDAKTAASMYAAVKARAEGEGPVRMVSLIQEVLKIQCSPSQPLTETAARICDIVNRIFAIQALDKDLFKCVVLLNSLNAPQYEPIQAQISRGLADATSNAPYTSDNIRKLLETVQNLTTLKVSSASQPVDTALAVTTPRGRFRSTKPWLPGHTHHAGVKCCSTCAAHNRSCGGHEAPYCAHPGGAMEKAGFEAAKAAARAAGVAPAAKEKQTSNTTPKSYMQLTGPKGKVYLVEAGDLGRLQTLNTESATPDFAGLTTDAVLAVNDDIEWEGWMATVEGESDIPEASVDWAKCTQEVSQMSHATVAPVDQRAETALTLTAEYPFFIDSGATVHISRCKTDFYSL